MSIQPEKRRGVAAAVMAILHPSRQITVAVLAWSGWFLFIALKRYRYQRFCEFVCGPFTIPELLADERRAMDWQTPLLMAVVPLALLVCWMVLRRRR